FAHHVLTPPFWGFIDLTSGYVKGDGTGHEVAGGGRARPWHVHPMVEFVGLLEVRTGLSGQPGAEEDVQGGTGTGGIFAKSDEGARELGCRRGGAGNLKGIRLGVP